MTNYEKETLKNLERTARHGLILAEKHKESGYVDYFNHILTELGRLDYEFRDTPVR